MKNNQKGSVQGIIVIVILLSLVVFWGVRKIQHYKQVANLKEQITSLGKTVANQQGHLPEIINKYNKNYLQYLNKSGKLPNNMPYANDAVSADNNARIKAFLDAYGVVIFEVSNIDQKTCVALATTDWGNLRTNQFAGLGIGRVPNFGCLAKSSCKFDYVSTFPGTAKYPFTKERASYPCSLFAKAHQPATVYLGYKLQ